MKPKLPICILFLFLLFKIAHMGHSQPNFHNLIAHTSDSIFERYLINGSFLANQGDHIGIQGGVISVVNADSISFIKGYGYSNIEHSTYFDPDQTKVMVASVAKIITTTAIMTMVREGKLDLDKEVNSYLQGIQIKSPFTQKILLKHLLTHTAGFDDTTIGSEARNAKGVLPLENYVQEFLPDIVWEPGKFYNYSNFSFVLLALIVQEQSGILFEDYVQKNILVPLEMENSGFGYSQHLLQNLMVRYKWNELDDQTGWNLETLGTKFTNRIGAAGFKTTAADMSKLLRMYLSTLKGSTSILTPENVRDMLSPKFSYDNRFGRAIGLGWQIRVIGQDTIFYHAGNDKGIESKIILIPTYDLGVFISLNNSDGASVIRAIDICINEFLAKNKIAGPPNTKISSASLPPEGVYQYMNDGQNTFEKVKYLFGSGSIEINSPNEELSINGRAYKSLGDNFFIHEESGRKAKFLSEKEKFYYSSGMATYRKLEVWEQPSLHVYILFGSFIILLLSIFWPIRLLFRNYRRKMIALQKLYWLLWSASISFVAFFIVFALSADTMPMEYELPLIFKAIFLLPLIGVFFSIWSMVLMYQKIKTTSLTRLSIIHLSITTIAFIAVCMIYNYYNLIGFNFV